MASNANQATLEQEVQALRSYAAEYSQQFELLSQQLRFIETARAESLASIEARCVRSCNCSGLKENACWDWCRCYG